MRITAVEGFHTLSERQVAAQNNSINDWGLVRKVWPLCVLPIISPFYETLFGPNEFPIWLELLLSGISFSLALKLVGLKLWGRALWIFVFCTYGSIAGYVFLWGSLTQGRLFGVTLVLAASCFYCLWSMHQAGALDKTKKGDAGEKTSKGNQLIVFVFLSWLFWIVISLFDYMLANRIFLLSPQLRTHELKIFLLTFCIALPIAYLHYWQEKIFGLRFVLMPILLVIFVAACTVSANAYGLFYIAYTSMAGDQVQGIFRITEKETSASKFCRRKIFYVEEVTRSNTSQCVGLQQFSDVEIGYVAEAFLKQSQFGVYLVSKPVWKPPK
jgi:hypothetical protein